MPPFAVLIRIPGTAVTHSGRFIDTWRHLNPSATEYTYYSKYPNRRNKQERSSQNHNGFRLDYVFVSPPLRDGIISARHVHHVREQELSDHSIVVSELDV